MTPYEIIQLSSERQVFGYLQLMCMIWIIIETLLSVFDGFASVIFLRAFLGAKEGQRFRRLTDAAFSLIYAAVLTIEYIFCGWFENGWLILLSLPLWLLLVCYAFLRCKGRIAAKIFLPLAANSVIMLVKLFSNLMRVEIMGKMAERFFGWNQLEIAWSVLFLLPILIYFVFYIILRLFHRTDITGKKSLVQWTLVSGNLAIGVISAFHLFITYAYDGTNHVRLRLFAVTVILCIILSDVFMFLLISDILKKNKAVNELKLLKQTEEYNRQYISHLLSEYETVRKLRHDSKNSLLALSVLLDGGETEKAKKQICESLDQLNESEVFISTDNAVVNAVVNAKLSAAKALGISCQCLAVKDISSINEYDLCRLISNMLDNAIEACNLEPEGKKRLEVCIRENEASYMFTVKNAVTRSVLEANPELASTKEDASEHGFGVKIIRDIADKYDGRSDFYEEDGMFCCTVCLRKGSGNQGAE